MPHSNQIVCSAAGTGSPFFPGAFSACPSRVMCSLVCSSACLWFLFCAFVMFGLLTNVQRASLPRFVCVFPVVLIARCILVSHFFLFPSPSTSYTHLLAFTGMLRTRDLHKLDPAFMSSSDPCLFVRKHCIILNAVTLKAVILHNKCLLLVPDGADSILSGMLFRFYTLQFSFCLICWVDL